MNSFIEPLPESSAPRIAHDGGAPRPSPERPSSSRHRPDAQLRGLAAATSFIRSVRSKYSPSSALPGPYVEPSHASHVLLRKQIAPYSSGLLLQSTDGRPTKWNGGRAVKASRSAA